jgi:hypothetical protein
MTVVVKPIDEYRSKVFKGKTITQYIVYLMNPILILNLLEVRSYIIQF